MPLIKNQKDLQKTLIELHDFYYSEALKIRSKYEDEDELPDEELYPLGKMEGADDAIQTLYCALYGGEALTKLLFMTWDAYAKKEEQEEENNGEIH